MQRAKPVHDLHPDPRHTKPVYPLSIHAKHPLTQPTDTSPKNVSTHTRPEPQRREGLLVLRGRLLKYRTNLRDVYDPLLGVFESTAMLALSQPESPVHANQAARQHAVPAKPMPEEQKRECVAHHHYQK